jgi:tRNA pseudouridine38-40 synthase
MVARRVALGVEYDGAGFHGWQTQPHARNVQDVLQAALSRVADHPVEVVAAGRTDTGVHATGQVVHFETFAERSPHAWLLGVNTWLPADVAVQWVRDVPNDFHARYAAIGRSYRYTVLRAGARSALLRERAWWIHRPLDIGAMSAAASYLLGEHDFSAFRAAACQARRPWRHLRRVALLEEGECLHLEFTANAFLHHMVRNLVGALCRVGRGEEAPAWVAGVLAARDRRHAGITAPAQGLCLTAVEYPLRFALPLAPGGRGPGR